MLLQGLRSHWSNSFFELIVGRTLQLLGASVELEPESRDGRRPDYLARFADADVAVEATVPVVNPEVSARAARQAPLLEILEGLSPPGWGFMVLELPDLGPTDSRKEFKASATRILEVDPPDGSGTHLLVAADTRHGPLRLRLVPWNVDGSAWLSGPGSGLIDNTQARLRRAIGRKRAQVRGADRPAILALKGGGLLSKFDDFDAVLFGTHYEYRGLSDSVPDRRFQPDGVFARESSSPPTYAAILAFLAVDFPVCVQPVLYVHPRFSGRLPKSLLALETRTLAPVRDRICVEPAHSASLLAGLHLVDADC